MRMLIMFGPMILRMINKRGGNRGGGGFGGFGGGGQQRGQGGGFGGFGGGNQNQGRSQQQPTQQREFDRGAAHNQQQNNNDPRYQNQHGDTRGQHQQDAEIIDESDIIDEKDFV